MDSKVFGEEVVWCAAFRYDAHEGLVGDVLHGSQRSEGLPFFDGSGERGLFMFWRGHWRLEGAIGLLCARKKVDVLAGFAIQENMESEIQSPLSRNSFAVKEHVGMFKAANNYDICDPETGAIVLECREERLGVFTKILRFTDYKRMTPFHIEIREPSGKTLIEVKRGISFILSSVEVFDGEGVLLGRFKQKFFSLGGKFDVYGPDNTVLCSLKGKWTGWDFFFGLDGVEFGRVSKKWAGIGKELFTSADNYMLTIDPSLEPDHPLRKLIVAAVMCIDMVLKE